MPVNIRAFSAGEAPSALETLLRGPDRDPAHGPHHDHGDDGDDRRVGFGDDDNDLHDEDEDEDDDADWA